MLAWGLCFVLVFSFFLFTIAWRVINGSLEHTEENQYQKWLLVFKQKSRWKLCKVDFIHYQHGKSLEWAFLNCQYFELMSAAGKLRATLFSFKLAGVCLMRLSLGFLIGNWEMCQQLSSKDLKGWNGAERHMASQWLSGVGKLSVLFYLWVRSFVPDHSGLSLPTLCLLNRRSWGSACFQTIKLLVIWVEPGWLEDLLTSSGAYSSVGVPRCRTLRVKQLVLHLAQHRVQLSPLQQDRVLHKKEGSVLININIHVIARKPAHITFRPLNVNAYFNTLSLPPS